MRRAAIDDAGLFDEGFFMYVEEVDWCYRFKRAGWEVWHCPDGLAIHHGGRSTRQQPAAMFLELHRSRWRFYWKHYPWWFRALARPILWAGLGRQALQHWAAAGGAAEGRPDRRERRERALACLQAMRL